MYRSDTVGLLVQYASGCEPGARKVALSMLILDLMDWCATEQIEWTDVELEARTIWAEDLERNMGAPLAS